MSKKEPPEGQLFSRVYLERTEPARDSPRFRTRIYGYYAQHFSSPNNLAEHIATELGVEVPTSNGFYNFQQLFLHAQVRDVLDTISLITRLIERQARRPDDLESWLGFVQPCF